MGMAENTKVLHELAVKYLKLIYPVSCFYDIVITELNKYTLYETALESCGQDTRRLKEAHEQALMAYANLKVVTTEYHNSLHNDLRTIS